MGWFRPNILVLGRVLVATKDLPTTIIAFGSFVGDIQVGLRLVTYAISKLEVG
jgi:hypothetical protein